MDGTLISQKSIFVFAQKFGYYNELKEILKKDILPYQKNKQIALYLKGRTFEELLEIFQSIPLSDNVHTIISELHNNNIATAVVTASYQFLADNIKHHLNLDFAAANNLIFNQNIVTGQLKIHNSTKVSCGDGLIYSICKGQVLEHLCQKLRITPHQVIAVGDGLIDISMLKKAGIGIAYNAPNQVQQNADLITDDMRTILQYI
jgi:phosphoserine phosphatase